MSQAPAYTSYHPRWHRARVSTYWWLGRWSYLAFILRELSSVFIAWFVVFTLLQVRAVEQGREGLEAFWQLSKHPLVLALNVVSLFFVLFHAVTWFNLAPKAMVVRLAGRRVPGRWIVISNLVVWALFSGFVTWLVLREADRLP
jgi:fumarate reductase subunit C